MRSRRHRFSVPSLLILTLLFILLAAPAALAFCGFFVAKLDTPLNNSSSRVVIAHSGNRSVFMMANDFQGDVKDFARIVPIPVIPKREQVRIGDLALVNQLVDYTAPRLAEYTNNFNRLCEQEYWNYASIGLLVGLAAFLIVPLFFGTRRLYRLVQRFAIVVVVVLLAMIAMPSFLNQANKVGGARQPLTSSVTITDQFTVGEYDVTLLSAQESNGLLTWLQQNGYQVPAQAAPMLQDYIRQGMKFFVVRVNLAAFQKQGLGYLRPIILDYESDKFMLPIRLGTLNGKGDQDLTIVILSPKSYVETANYRTVTIPTDAQSTRNHPSGQELPTFIAGEFNSFFQAVFQREYERQGKKAVFLEYAGATGGGFVGDMSRISNSNQFLKCDPCSLPPEEIGGLLAQLPEAGAFWPDAEFSYVTRLHVRYNAQTFPQDLVFKEVAPEKLIQRMEAEGKLFPNSAGVAFQGRYVIRRTIGQPLCLSARPFWGQEDRQVKHLAELTGWDPTKIRQKISLNSMDDAGQTALHRAKTLAEMKDLVERGASVNLRNSGPYRNTPLLTIIKNSNPEAPAMVAYLLKQGADPNLADLDGNTPLHWATIGQSPSLVQLLLENNANPNARNMAWNTPLHKLTQDRTRVTPAQLQIAQLLVKSGADPKAQNQNGESPQQQVLPQTNPELAKLLQARL